MARDGVAVVGGFPSLCEVLCAKSRPPGLLQVKCIVLQVLRGLQYLHRNFIIHRWAGLVAWGRGDRQTDSAPTCRGVEQPQAVEFL